MVNEPVLLDTDTLSELSRGNPRVLARARTYLASFGRLTISSVTVFERLRGYHWAIRAGKPLQRQLQAFETLAASSVVLPFDGDAAAVAATIWAAASRRQRQHLGDVLIAAIAVSRRIPLATRNVRDFDGLVRSAGVPLRLTDWAAATKGSGPARLSKGSS
jgi:predicted nucleic acid-binding protein